MCVATLPQKEETLNPFKYTGEVYDEETGLYYLRARYYDPSMRRFLNEDTYEGQIDNPLSQNLYTYVHNNPLIYTDPTGHFAQMGTGGVGGSMGERQYVDLSTLTQLQLSSIIADNSNTQDTKAAAMAEIIKRNFMLIENGAYKAAAGAKGLFNMARKALQSEKKLEVVVNNSLKGIKAGIAQSRINISNKGWTHVLDRHFSEKAASQFTISQNELRNLLSSKDVIGSPIIRTIDSADGVRYVREITFNQVIGLDKMNDYNPTTIMTILTDVHGNLVTATPGVIK
jgi:RHS repeat-associated protein